MEIIDIRLKLIEDRITNPEFLKSKRIAGEVPFYIFDYSPEYELKVRKFTKELTKRVKEYYGINVIKLNLFELYTRYRDWETDRKSTRLNSSHRSLSRMPSSA